MSQSFAKGNQAWGECQRSGKKMLLKDLVEDGYYPGLLVAPDWYEPRHPQERLKEVSDPIALEKPAPDLSKPPGEGTPAPPLTFDPF